MSKTATARASTLLAVLLVALASGGLSAQDKRPLTLDDYGAWSRITQVTLSPDGRWLAYAHQPNDGDATLYVKELEGDRVHQATNGAGVHFSSDGRWVAFLSSPPESEGGGGVRAGRGGPPGGGRGGRGGGDAGGAAGRTLHLIDLVAGTESEQAGVQSFAFSEDGRRLAIHRVRTDSDAEHRGSDLILRDLAAGTSLSFGNVAAYAFNEPGTELAYLVDADAMAGNGLYVVTPADGRIRSIDTGELRYDDLTWNEAGDAVAALRGQTPEGMTQRANALVVSRGIGGTLRTTVWDPATDASFPSGFVLSEDADTRWSEDGDMLIVGIKEQEPELEDERDEDDRPDVDVWHWADERLQSVQMIQAGADRRFTYTSVYHVDDGTFRRLAADDMRRVDVERDWGLGRRDAAYRGDLTVAGGLTDFVRIDLGTGETRDVVTGIRRPMGTSPDGEWFVYLEDEQVWAVELASLERQNLSERAGIDFVNREFDVVNEAPAYGIAGWTEDGSVLLEDRWDVYAVPLEGGDVVHVTGDMGNTEQIEFRIERLDSEEDYVDPDDMLLSGYGEWTKKSGYFRARPGRAPQPLLFGDEMIGDVRKADDADRIVFTRQTFEQFPDYWMSDTDFDDPVRVTDANPQIAEFKWGRRILIDYTDERGNRLQATLALPADYVEGQRYPMLVYFYEKMSQRHHEFSMPVYDDRPHMSTYASNGYLVLMPDIVYDDGYPGSSALDDVIAAARRAIDLGYADPDHIGLQGHSWGGYETSFILTQTDMFATIVTGAPLTNLMSMNNILYKRTGNQNGPILQWSQGRMGDQPWDDLERWISQSPVHHAPNISTPFLILQGTADGAVDWNQGLELYTAARRLGKEVILLSYPDEPHHLAREANQKDFQRRMMEFFDYHLKGAEPADWITNGVPFLLKGREGGPRIIS